MDAESQTQDGIGTQTSVGDGSDGSRRERDGSGTQLEGDRRSHREPDGSDRHDRDHHHDGRHGKHRDGHHKDCDDAADRIVERPADGQGSNTQNPEWGATHQELLRLSPINFADGIGEMRTDLPNAREISNAVAAETGDEPAQNQALASDFLWAWGQFIDHDLDLTEAGTTEQAPIFAPIGDPEFDPEGDGGGIIAFTRVDSLHDDPDAPRTYANEITAFLDAGMIYGSSAETQAALRGDGGYMLMDGGYLVETDGGVLAGDVRAAENVALTTMHTLFALEHNRLVTELAEAHPDWSSDDLFNAARMRVEAIVQAITYNEFLPIIVGEDAIADYRGYDASVNPGISVEFSTAAFRFGHSLLSASIQRLEENGESIEAGALSLRDAFFNPSEIRDNGGIDPILRGLADQTASALDTMIVDDVRSFLFGGGSVGLDLASLNIQRGRDLGVASYNDLREALGFDRAEDFADITSDADLAARLASVYESVDQVDAWVGGLAEDAYGDGLLGQTFATIIIDQFERVRDGDPYWSQAGALSRGEVNELWDTTLADVIVRNTDIDDIQSNVFLAFDRQGGDAGDNLLIGGEGRDLLLGLDGDDTLDGGAGDDQLSGGEGVDQFLFDATSGHDLITDFSAEDMLVVAIGGLTDASFRKSGDDLVVTFAPDVQVTLLDQKDLDPDTINIEIMPG